ncbi:MAG: nicotinate phosphoribosyltransferase, partial [Pseudomonadota bacterium]
AVLERNAPAALRGYHPESEIRHLIGTGVSAAAVWYMRERLDEAGFDKVKIVASSGFNPEKCRIMKEANAPIDIIGTGSYLPSKWSETYATADIVEYDGVRRVKTGREFLFPRPNQQRGQES